MSTQVGTKIRSSSSSSQASAATSGIRRVPAHTHTSSSSKLKTSTSSSSEQIVAAVDWQACLEILSKLAPAVSAELPSLFVTPPLPSPSPSTGAVAGKRKLDPTSGKTVDERHERHAASPSVPSKRQRRSDDQHNDNDESSTRASRSGKADPPASDPAAATSSSSSNKASSSSAHSTSSASSASSSSNHSSTSGRPLRRSDSTSSINTQATSVDGSIPGVDRKALAPADAASTASSEDHISPVNNLPSPASASASRLADAPTSSAVATVAQEGVARSSNIWTKQRLRRLAASCREKGKTLKHSGDRRMREYRPSHSNRHIPVLALLEQVDAVLLYAYAFWCEDQAAGSARTRQPSSSITGSSATASSSGSGATGHARTASFASDTGASPSFGQTGGGISPNPAASPPVNTSTSAASGGPGTASWRMTCIQENWRSIFGLMAFVRGRAEKLVATYSQASGHASTSGSTPAPEQILRSMELIVAWIGMLEAIILQHLSTHASRSLSAQASKVLNSSMSPPDAAGSPDSERGSATVTASSLPSAASPSSSNDSFMQSFIKLQADLERVHSLWPSSQATLLNLSNQASPNIRSAAFSSASSSGRDNSRRSGEDREDVLARTLRKGGVCYDTEPTCLDDVVVPTLTKLGDQEPLGPEDLFRDEENYFRFAWPIVLHSQNSVPHATSFGRALLTEISERLSLNYVPPVLGVE